MKPYVIYHMVASIDGRITGSWLRNEKLGYVEDCYYGINRAYKADAFMCGRVTMQGSFAGNDVPDTSAYRGMTFPREDYIADAQHGYYAVSVDTHGRVNWQDSCIHDYDPGYDNAHIIEILCESVSDEYLGFLRDRKISYLFCGKESLNEEMMLEKLYRYFNIRKLMNEGGAVLGGSFIRKHLIDELSIVMAPVCAGGKESTLVSDFEISDPDLWNLEKAEPFGQGGLHLVYRKNCREMMNQRLQLLERSDAAFSLLCKCVPILTDISRDGHKEVFFLMKNREQPGNCQFSCECVRIATRLRI